MKKIDAKEARWQKKRDGRHIKSQVTPFTAAPFHVRRIALWIEQFSNKPMSENGAIGRKREGAVHHAQCGKQKKASTDDTMVAAVVPAAPLWMITVRPKVMMAGIPLHRSKLTCIRCDSVTCSTYAHG